MLGHTKSNITQEAETGGSKVWGQSLLDCETLLGEEIVN